MFNNSKKNNSKKTPKDEITGLENELEECPEGPYSISYMAEKIIEKQQEKKRGITEPLVFSYLVAKQFPESLDKPTVQKLCVNINKILQRNGLVVSEDIMEDVLADFGYKLCITHSAIYKR